MLRMLKCLECGKEWLVTECNSLQEREDKHAKETGHITFGKYI